MSIRAHRIKRFEFDGESFSISQDETLMDFLNKNTKTTDGESFTSFSDQLNLDSCGYAEIPVEVLQRAVDKGIITDPSVLKSIKQDIAATKKQGDDWIRYWCF